ncbi:expressed unknown protein [Ectocarpus siliculosus]|uniref:Uncharacterized protein n=1 Tax=Ectocarpus siliculosus TaxID=2880 RepID=D7FU56_ECTSI|nr:expressed unknown protein [Ectocarpus siliculosus]|eukprot:CBJ31583.1 expressed unknown protein [Ectocarpus siliculosus]
MMGSIPGHHIDGLKALRPGTPERSCLKRQPGSQCRLRRRRAPSLGIHRARPSLCRRCGTSYSEQGARKNFFASRCYNRSRSTPLFFRRNLR